MTSSTPTWRATVLTLFPEMFPGPLGISLAGKALASGIWALETRVSGSISAASIAAASTSARSTMPGPPQWTRIPRKAVPAC